MICVGAIWALETFAARIQNEVLADGYEQSRAFKTKLEGSL
jgi:hypothetical protein